MRILTLCILATGAFPVVSYAADIGTYRAGNSYMSSAAQSPDQCNSQCRGDARCKGWNFFHITPEQAICEFNSVRATPTANAFSISGENVSAGPDYNLLRGGERITRVGYVPAPSTQTFNNGFSGTGSAAPYSASVMPHSAQPRVVTRPARQIVQKPPQPQLNPQMAVQQRPAGMFKPQLDTSVQPSLYNRAPIAPRPAPSILKPMLDNARPQPTDYPRERSMNAVNTADSVETNRTFPALSQMPSNTPRPSLESGLAGGLVAGNLPRNSSLYGSLYDDVKVPRTLGQNDIPLDPDAPISTVKSIPVEGQNTTPY